jgi:hypothetical protein
MADILKYPPCSNSNPSNQVLRFKRISICESGFALLLKMSTRLFRKILLIVSEIQNYEAPWMRLKGVEY